MQLLSAEQAAPVSGIHYRRLLQENMCGPGYLNKYMRFCRKHFIVRITTWKTTWKLRLLLFLLLGIIFFLFKGFFLEQMAASLVCVPGSTSVDAVIIENFDPNYLLFEAVSTLKREGLEAAVYVPVKFNRDRSGANLVSEGTARLLASLSRVGEYELIMIDEKEPIRLNAARQVREYLSGKGYRSVLLVSSGFCSRRSLMVYRRVFNESGMGGVLSPGIQ